LLILKSWQRSTGRGRVVVSQGFVYSTITLVGVGIYLIASGLIARWVSKWSPANLSLEPIVFFVSVMILAAVLLATAFRHRTRRWMRRNLFAGNYDYRKLWMDATEKVRSIEDPKDTASALAQLIHDALGSLNVSVWLQVSNKQSMCRIGVRGEIGDS